MATGLALRRHSRMPRQPRRIGAEGISAAAAATSAAWCAASRARASAAPRWSRARARQSGRLMRLSRADSATSSISAIGGKPPAASNAARVTNMAWSPVAMPVSARAHVHHGGDDSRSSAAAVEAHVETAPGAAGARKPIQHQAVGVLRQSRVGVQEQQHVAARRGGAGIHLRGAPARGASTRSARGRASSGVPSLLPPSTTITSTPRAR